MLALAESVGGSGCMFLASKKGKPYSCVKHERAIYNGKYDTKKDLRFIINFCVYPNFLRAQNGKFECMEPETPGASCGARIFSEKGGF